MAVCVSKWDQHARLSISSITLMLMSKCGWGLAVLCHLAKYVVPKMQKLLLLGTYHLNGKTHGSGLFCHKRECRKLFVVDVCEVSPIVPAREAQLSDPPNFAYFDWKSHAGASSNPIVAKCFVLLGKPIFSGSRW